MKRAVPGTVLALIGSLLVSGLTTAAAYTRPGQTHVASSNASGVPGSNHAGAFAIYPSISGNGRFVAFSSESGDLVTPDLNPGVDTFLKDLNTGDIDLVTRRSDGRQALSPPWAVSGMWSLSHPSLSSNGRYVAFSSFSPDLVGGDTNTCVTLGDGTLAPAGTCPDIFVRDRKAGTTERISVASDGTEANDRSYVPSISDNGRYVTFESLASNLDPSDTNSGFDVFVHDRKTGKTSLVSAMPDGKSGSQESICNVIDGSGRYSAFISSNALDPRYDVGGVFVRDLRSNEIELVSLDTTESRTGNAGCNNRMNEAIGISTGGRFVSFSAIETSPLAPNDGNGASDIYVRDRELGRTDRVSVTSAGEESTPYLLATSLTPTMSDDGRFVTWFSMAENLFPGDDEKFFGVPGIGAIGDWDVFVHDRFLGLTRLVSMDTSQKDGACDPRVLPPVLPGDWGSAQNPSISGDGTKIAIYSCDRALTRGSDDYQDGRPVGFQVFVRDQGAIQGTSTADGTPTRRGSAAPQSSIFGADVTGDALGPGADIMSGRMGYRAELDDLYFALELEELSGPALPLAGFRFRVGSSNYELRAQQIAWGIPGSFALFEKVAHGWVEVTSLHGGYGTTGESVVLSLPLATIDADAEEIVDVEGFTAIGSLHTGEVKELDSVKLRSFERF